MNENYHHPDMPLGAEEGIVRGMYLLEEAKNTRRKTDRVQLLGSGTILREVLAAAVILREEFGINSDVWSATSINELRRDGLACERWNLLNPTTKKPKVPYVTQLLQERTGPVICATDYMKSYGEQLRPYIPHRFTVLGTDGFGRSDTRAKLRHHFEVNRYFVVIAALKALADEGRFKAEDVAAAIKKFGIDPNKRDPMTC
jgi:pyruvate dehydrogenase E1 component